MAAELYPLAVRQARGRIAIQVAACLAFLVVAVAFASQRLLVICFIPALGIGAVHTVRDIRWWLWFRTARPTEAMAALQARNERPPRLREVGVAITAIIVFLIIIAVTVG